MYIFNNRLFQVLGLLSVVLSSPARPENQILPSVVRIQVITPNGTMRGTGFAVEGGVITAAHVVEKSNEVDILCGDGDDTVAFSGDVIRKDTLLDLAFIRVKNDFDKVINLPPVKFDTSFPVNPGTPVYAIGNSLGFTRSISAGIVSASGKKSGERFLYSDVLTRKGNSGGPLVNSKGEVIAITLGTIDFNVIGEAKIKDSSPEFTYCVPASDIVGFLESHKTNRKNNAFVGVLGKSVATGLDHPGLEQALQITRTVRPCGLQPGDVVYILADQTITSQRDIVRVIRTLQPGSLVKADILRNGKFETVNVSVTETP
jgi:serine protease Do